jgi:beta-lactamase superfamily II metal-dependent hydrolase
MPQLAQASDAVADRIEIHLLNEGKTSYGDCILCIFGTITVLIDGSHPGDDQSSDRIENSIPEQLAALLGQSADSLHVNLLVVTHTHADHFGCLPALVLNGTLKSDWALVADPELGWGHGPGEQTDAALDPRVRAAMEFARDDTSEAVPFSLSSFAVSDARVSQEETYNKMVTELESSSRTVRYRDNQSPHGKVSQQALLDAFNGMGLEIRILGPTAKQLFLCADGIAKSLDTVRDMATDAINRMSSDSDTVMSLDAVFTDASKPSRAGNFVNLQSVVFSLNYRGKKFLFNGDMQLIDPTTQFSHVPIPGEIHQELDALKQRIADAAPFDFAKLGHHGSHNATDADYMKSLGDTVLFGISLGQFSPTHPSPEVLDLLKSMRQKIQWLRTDFNGLSSFYFDRTGVRYEMESGRINDIRPNPGKQGTSPEDALILARPAARAVAASRPSGNKGDGGALELDAVMPFGDGEARVSLKITPPASNSAVARTRGSSISQPRRPEPKDAGRSDLPTSASSESILVPPPVVNFASGRILPKLLFVTSEATLCENIGRDETALAINAIRSAGMPLISDLAQKLTLADFSTTANRVAETLRSDSSIQGVVILGGMDVAPSRQIDTLPASLRPAVQPADDPFDNFIVWCDDDYGKRGIGDFLPVSRIPDGQYAPLVFRALSAPNATVTPKYKGIRNLARPFVTQVSPFFPDDTVFLVSGPTLYNNPAYYLQAEHAYIMLHGDFSNGREYVGETAQGGYLSAMRMENVPDVSGHIVLAGCCWGALTTSITASRSVANQLTQSKGHNGSIALKFLENGALAFVGSTGAHYPPQRNEDPNTLGGAMHKAFWKFALDGSCRGPAEALCKAKGIYSKEMPHGQTDPFRQAAEYKTYYQFTCLGLGW